MPTPDVDVLRALFEQAPADAMAYIEKKGLRITFNWFEMLDEAHARAFTVAKAMRMDVLRDIRRALLGALEKGQTLRDFTRDLAPALMKQGWWGKQVVVDSQGEAQVVQLGSVPRLKTIYQTNLQSAYMAGRRLAQVQARSARWLMYVAVMDARTRPTHAALNGKIWAADDPVWEVIDPPRGYNCRCRTRSLSDAQMRREGLTPSEPPQIIERAVDAGLDEFTGELFPTMQRGIRTTDAQGKELVSWTDVGFNRSQLASHVFDDLLARKAVAALGDEAGFVQVRKVVLAPPRMKAWEAFVQNTLLSGLRTPAGDLIVQNQTMTVGMLPLPIARALVDQKTPFAPVLFVEDRIIAGKKARRHEHDGNALLVNQWMSLPTTLQGATFYYDRSSGNVVAVMNAGPDKVLKAVFSPTGAADTAFMVPAISIRGAIIGGAWELLGNQRGT